MRVSKFTSDSEVSRLQSLVERTTKAVPMVFGLLRRRAAQKIDGLLDGGNLDHLDGPGNRDRIGVILGRAEEIGGPTASAAKIFPLINLPCSVYSLQGKLY
jgi:hypothetical protein